MEEPGSRWAEAGGLRIDAVEVLPTDLRLVLLRVAGAWEGPPPERLAAPVLVLRESHRRNRIHSVAAHAWNVAAPGGGWPGATLIDPAVLAEHRARRAELSYDVKPGQACEPE